MSWQPRVLEYANLEVGLLPPMLPGLNNRGVATTAAREASPAGTLTIEMMSWAFCPAALSHRRTPAATS